MYLAFLPSSSSQVSAPGTEVPTSLRLASLKLPTHKDRAEVTSTQDTFYTTNERDCIEKAEEPQELSGDCRNSLGSEGLMSATVYIPSHPHMVGRGQHISELIT